MCKPCESFFSPSALIILTSYSDILPLHVCGSVEATNFFRFGEHHYQHMKLSQCIMFTVSIAHNETHVDIVINYLCVCFLLFLTGNAVDLYINTMGLGIEYLLQLTCARIILNYFKQMTGAQYNIVQKFCTFYYE